MKGPLPIIAATYSARAGLLVQSRRCCESWPTRDWLLNGPRAARGYEAVCSAPNGPCTARCGGLYRERWHMLTLRMSLACAVTLIARN